MTYLEKHSIVHGSLCTRSLGFARQTLTVKLVMPGIQMLPIVEETGRRLRQSLTSSSDLQNSPTQPVRWLSPEVALLATASTAGDVFSFALCVWYMLVYCSQQPYAQLSDAQVWQLMAQALRHEETNVLIELDGCNSRQGNQYLSRSNDECGNSLRFLQPQPSQCDQRLFELLLECWTLEPMQRPSFAEINAFFSGKTTNHVEQPSSFYKMV
jgi:discoidin domain receptor family protein 1